MRFPGFMHSEQRGVSRSSESSLLRFVSMGMEAGWLVSLNAMERRREE